jgi:methyl-accepting chemotaxis protein
MGTVLDIRVQKLFLLTLVLKVGSSFLGWYFQDPWVLGFTVPLLLMGVYIALGYNRRDNDVSDEKFADSCYYLGFIFTITSIIFSLFDLPDIGTRIQDIAVRFGAAMVSTVLGLAVRVYLVSFRKEIGDAIVEAEDAVMDATAKFTEQLKVTLERLRDFEGQVDGAARTSVERVNIQIENLSKNHADKLTAFFTELTQRNQEAFTNALGEVKSASFRLSESVDGYSHGMRTNLASIEAKVVAFTDAVTARLTTTTFPDDYFARQLEAPLGQLREATGEVTATFRKASNEVNDSSAVLSKALNKLRQKASSVDGTLEALGELSNQHQLVLAATQTQLNVVSNLATTLAGVDGLLSRTVAGIDATNGVTSELAARVSLIVAEGADARKNLETSLADVIDRLQANHIATESVATKLAESAATSQAVSASLASNVKASEALAGKLDAVIAADLDAANRLDGLGKQGSNLLDKVDNAVSRLNAMVAELSGLDIALRAQSFALKQVAEQMADVKVVVEIPQPRTDHLAVESSVRSDSPSSIGLG